MRKMICILILVLGFGLVSNGQLYPPIQPYLENDYSIEQIKKFAMSETQLSSNWRKEFLRIVNKGLSDAGENLVLDERNILWILDNVTYERRNLKSFTNTRKIGSKIDFFIDHNYDGMVGVFNYGKCSLVVFKTRCINLLEVPVQVVQKNPQEQSVPVSTTKKEEISLPVDFGTTTSKAVAETQKAWEYERTESSPKKKKEIKILWFVVPVAAILGGLATYLLLKKDKVDPIPIIEPRTMPGGIPSVPVPATPGVPSDPRGMPSGTGG